MAGFISTRKGRRRKKKKRGTKQRGKVFQMKEEKENISFNFYLQVLSLQSFSGATRLNADKNGVCFFFN